MKKKDIIAIDNFIATLKLACFDKEARAALVSIHLSLYRVVKDFQDDVNELRKSYISGKEDRVNELTELRNRLENAEDKEAIQQTISTDFADILALEVELNAKVQEMLEHSVDIPVKKIGIDAFLDGLIAIGMEVSASDLVMFDPILKR